VGAAFQPRHYYSNDFSDFNDFNDFNGLNDLPFIADTWLLTPNYWILLLWS